MSTDADVDPWERQKGESPIAYGGFVTYRDLGLTRTLTKAVAAFPLRPDGKPRHSLTVMKDWSATHGWVDRCLAYDREMDRLYRAEQLELRKDAAKDQRTIARGMIAVVAKRLRTEGEDLAAKLSLPQLARWAEVAVKIERLALGDATEIVDTGEQVERPEDDDVIRRILEDPEATEMAMKLMDRAQGVTHRAEALATEE